jgi:class 3 adenylate cyclase
MKKFCVCVIFLATILQCSNPNKLLKFPLVEKGIIDLRNWDFASSGIMNLNGEWEFHWEKFLSSNDFIELNSLEKIPPREFISVPNSWNGFKVSSNDTNPKILDGNGYATYRLMLLTDGKSSLSIQLPTMGTAYNFYINGIVFASVGKLGTTLEESKPDYKVQIVRLPQLASGKYEFIFQISNFHYKQGGIWFPIPIGTDSAIIKEREKNLLVDFFLSGALLIMGLYHLGLFFVKRKDNSALYFGLTCCLISVRTLLTGEFFLYSIIPSFPFDLGIKLEYAAFYLGIPFFLLYVKEIFPEDSPKIPMYIIQVCSYILLIPVIIFPPRIFTHTVLAMQAVTIFAIITGLYIFIRAIKNKREGAKSFLAGSFFLILSIFNDILHTNLIIYTGYFLPFGLFIFVFSQAFLLSARFAKAFQQVEDLSENLEKKVIERTNELDIAKNLAEYEQEKSEKLLLNILPSEVAIELKEKGNVSPVLFKNTSILFTDFQGFTQIAEGLSPQALVQELDYCFSQFDRIVENNNLEKLKTIGDSYMCAGGIPKSNQTHAIDSCLAALEIQFFMNEMKIKKQASNIPHWNLRLGIHSGSVIAGVVGERKFAYDIWGDTVNLASRMESSGMPGRINVSDTTYSMIQDFFDCEFRGEIEAKNKGKIKMYFVNRIKAEYSRDTNGIFANEKLLQILKNKVAMVL